MNSRYLYIFPAYDFQLAQGKNWRYEAVDAERDPPVYPGAAFKQKSEAVHEGVQFVQKTLGWGTDFRMSVDGLDLDL